MTTIILYTIAVIVAILLGIRIGKKKGRITGWLEGREFCDECWKKNLPKEIYQQVIDQRYSRLLNLVNMSDEEFDKWCKED